MSNKKQPNDFTLDTSLVQNAPPEAQAALQEMIAEAGGPTAFANKLAAMAAALEASGEETYQVGEMHVGRLERIPLDGNAKGTVRVVDIQESAEDPEAESTE